MEQQANKLELDFQQEELQQLKSEAEHMKIKAEKVGPMISYIVTSIFLFTWSVQVMPMTLSGTES